MQRDLLQQASHLITNARRLTAFTGAGISVESGIPPFRGQNGIWSQYDASSLDIEYFQRNPLRCWETIKRIFYESFRAAEPNPAHFALAELEQRGYLQALITQNIDNLHQKAGSCNIIEYHGNSQRLICTGCGRLYPLTEGLLSNLPPRCAHCQQVLKPDFVFFGEAIPAKAWQNALRETQASDVWLVIGTSGEVYPAASLPVEAKQNGGKIIEVNISPSHYTAQVTDLFLQGNAGAILTGLAGLVKEAGNRHLDER
jgi:NAD-dependent deacetylase